MILDNMLIMVKIDRLRDLGFKELATIKFNSDLCVLVEQYVENKVWNNN
jgi:hypothetical protein